MANLGSDQWVPLEEAASAMNRKVDRIKSQMRNGRIRRDVHFRLSDAGHFELNVTEYLKWLEDEKERRKLPFLERVRLSQQDFERDLNEVSAPVSKPKANPKPDAPSSKRRPKLIPVSVWAEETFGEYGPSRNTLYNWIKMGLIHPMPTRVGRRYFCSPDAEYWDPVAQKIRRMVNGR